MAADATPIHETDDPLRPIPPFTDGPASVRLTPWTLPPAGAIEDELFAAGIPERMREAEIDPTRTETS